MRESKDRNGGRTKTRKEVRKGGENGTVPALLGWMWIAHAFCCQNINDKLLHLLF
jgi:hypothetical protein